MIPGHNPHVTSGNTGRIVHFSDPSAVVLTAKIRTFFKGTNVALVPSSTRGTYRITDPYGRQMPWFRVQRANGRYFFIEQRSEK